MNILVNFLILCIISYTQGDDSKSTIYGTKNYTIFQPGTLNIIITAPHGGYQAPTDITNRTSDSLGNLKGDYNTKKLAISLRDELAKLFQENENIEATPFLVYSDLIRVKLDPNRNASSACQNEVDDCQKAYTDFHSFITDDFQRDFMVDGLVQYAQGLLLDIHGQSHPEKWVELGYLLKAKDLDNNLDSEEYFEKNSIRQMYNDSEYSLEELIRGSKSLGSILETTYNIKSVPSPTHNVTNGGRYYSGGFITKNHGSRDLPKHRVNAIQLELPYMLRKNSQYKNTSRILAKAVYDYYILNNLGKKLTNGTDRNYYNCIALMLFSTSISMLFFLNKF